MPLKHRYGFANAKTIVGCGGINRTINMKSLTNQQSEQLNFFKSELRQKQENIESAIADFNANVKQLLKTSLQVASMSTT